MENLLSHVEIEEILNVARLNPSLQHPYAISFGHTRTSIIKITPKEGLILIQGDSDTGFTHIRDRHSYWSEKTYWRKDIDGKIESPSQFGKESMPIIDYVEILDDLYKNENLNKKKNKKPDAFEMYSGIATSKNLSQAKYHMLLYKDTKIVHTLYPHTRKRNKKKIIDYIRGKPKGSLHFNPTEAVIAIPYTNQVGNVIFSFQIVYNYDEKIEQGIIVNHKLKKVVNIYERSIEKIVDLTVLIQDIERVDLSKVEEIIKRLDNK